MEGATDTNAGGAVEPSADEIAKSLANPNTPLATLNLKLQYRTFDGDQPSYDPVTGEFDSVAGLGDIAFDLAYGGATKGGLTWAAGIISTLPTATKDELGADRWNLGPEIMLAKPSSKSVLGGLVTYQTDIGGSGDADISLTPINAIAVFLPGGGWNVGSQAIMSGRPWKFGVEVNYYVEKPDAIGPEWMIGLNIGPVVKNVMADWFK